MKDTAQLPEGWFVKKKTEDSLQLGLIEDDLNFKFFVKIHELQATTEVYGLTGPNFDMTSIKVKELLNQLTSSKLCPGVTDLELQEFASVVQTTDSYYRIVRPAKGHNTTSRVRSKACQIVLDRRDVCAECHKVSHLLKAKQMRRLNANIRPIKTKTPLKSVTPKQFENAFKEQRKQNTDLQKRLQKLQTELAVDINTVEMSKTTHEGLKQFMDNQVKEPLAKLFWEEQLKAFKRKDRGMRWHPMLIRLAILLRSQSPQAYETIRNTGILKLPGGSTLREYTNLVRPTEGFQAEQLEDLRQRVEQLPEEDRYAVLMVDEMKIKQNLVFDEATGRIVGFTDIQDWCSSSERLATSACVFYVVFLTVPIEMSLGYFGTRGITGAELFPLMWEATGYLEMSCNTKVLAWTADKASCNMKMFRMHGIDADGLYYWTTNRFAPDRKIFFVSDPPHLMKTNRNILTSSGNGPKQTKYLWNNGSHLLWDHFGRVQLQDTMYGLRRTNLTHQHIVLNSFSVMNVKLAVQTLSRRVGKVMQEHGGPDCQETARWTLLLDKMFDCTNARSPDEKRDARKPFRRLDDPRFNFLTGTFTNYIRDWERSVETRPGFQGRQFKAARKAMFLTDQTRDGLLMTVHSITEATQHLLRNGVKMVLTNRFCQDRLEQHFGDIRLMGRRIDNPDLWTFGYQEMKLRLQRSLTVLLQPRAYVGGKKRTNRMAIVIDNEPLPKIRK